MGEGVPNSLTALLGVGERGSSTIKETEADSIIEGHLAVRGFPKTIRVVRFRFLRHRLVFPDAIQFASGTGAAVAPVPLI
jgi:hypothetical protein